MTLADMPIHKNTTALIYFGDQRRSFEPLYNHWLDCFERTQSESNLVMVTTEDTILPRRSIPHLRFDLKPWKKVLRPGCSMDVKEAVALAAMLAIDGPLLIVDADAMFQSCPWKILEREARPATFAMGIDCGERMLNPPDGTCPEHNAGVLWFAQADAKTRLRIAHQYTVAFDEMSRVPDKQPAILGQRAWSVAHWRLRGTILPKEVNWSHCWKTNSEAAVFHYHGNNGKRKLGIFPSA